MKKAYLKVIPFLVSALLAGTIMLTIEAFSSIKMMHVMDSALGNNNRDFFTEVIMLLVLSALSFPAQLLMVYGKALYKKRANKSLKNHYLTGLFEMDLQAYHGENSFHHVSAMTNDVSTLEANYTEGIFEVSFQIISFVIGVTVIAYVSPWILLAGIVIAGLSMLVSALVSKPLKRHQTQRSDLFSAYTAYIKEVLGAFHIIKVNNLSSKVRQDFVEKSTAIQDKGYTIDKISTFVHAFQNFFMTMTMLSIVGVSVWLTIQGHMTFGGIILVINSMERVMGPIMTLAEWFPKITASSILFQKLDRNLHVEKQHDEDYNLLDFKESIELKDVCFSYDEAPVFNHTNMAFESGHKYLVVGPSGGGKSTLLKLLRKYFSPQQGTILIDGVPLSKVTKASYYDLIANVEQNVFLFEDTLIHNLCLYKEYTKEQIDDAIEKAGLTQFVTSHPDGLNRMIYDNGKNLSGGERSRIAIARGLLQKAKIIFLDEAFSSLDATVAREIEKTLLSLKQITVINVSHVVFEETKPLYNRIMTIGKSPSY